MFLTLSLGMIVSWKSVQFRCLDICCGSVDQFDAPLRMFLTLYFMLQDFYRIMEERTKEVDPEMGYKVMVRLIKSNYKHIVDVLHDRTFYYLGFLKGSYCLYSFVMFSMFRNNIPLKFI